MRTITTRDFSELAVPDSVAIPASLEGARILLDGVGGLMSAGHWGTAAIVWAYTESGEPHFASGEKSSDGRLTISDFAALKIRGLTTRDSVRKYRQAWEDAIQQGWAEPAEPGTCVALPSEPFKTERKCRVAEAGDIEQQTINAYNEAIYVMRDEDMPDTVCLQQIDLIMAPLEPLGEKTQAIADRWDAELLRSDLTIEECIVMYNQAIQLARPIAYLHLLMQARIGALANEIDETLVRGED